MHLPVLNGADPQSDVRSELARGLASVARGQVRFSRHDRMLYSTDASMYQVEPLGVVVPSDVDDIARVMTWCFEHAVPMLPRGGGTSLAGQCTAQAVVIDSSSACRAIRNLDVAMQRVYCESGVAVDELNNHLSRAGCGLFFAPDPATTAQATIGGCLGNNAAGSRSVKYGRTVDNVLAIDAILSNGVRVRFEPGAGRRDPVALKLADGVASIVRQHERLIRERFPKTLRRNAGYALDLILQQLDAGITPHDLDLSRLLVGSEGTLAFTAGATLLLRPQPAAKALALLSFRSVDDAIAQVASILTTGPSAVELVDDVVIEAALGNIECRRYVAAFPTLSDAAGAQQTPDAVLYVEYHEPTLDALNEKFAKLRALVGATPLREVRDAAGIGDAWKLRKAGEPLLHGLPGARKPLTFVEDNAVPVERLGEFVREFRAIVQRAGTRAAFWAHASVGVLHVRPMLDIHQPDDKQRLLDIAVQVADLARRCGGVMSGEHGDGKVRGPLLERFFGPELCAAFAQVKALFDPKGLLNPGNIVNAGPVESIVQRTRYEPQTGSAQPTRTPEFPRVETFYTYEAEEGFEHAVELCSGAGVCRKQSGGTMCPSYRATDDERHSTRGRANALRLAITGQLPAPTGNTSAASSDPSPDANTRFNDPETLATLDLCLSCKACKSECPSNVDLARYKAEYLAQGYKVTGRVPLSKRLVGNVRALNRLGSITPALANWVNRLSPMRALINAVMRMHPRRSMPKFSPSLYRLWGRQPRTSSVGGGGGGGAGPRPKVVLYADCFTTYNESPIGLAAKRVLERLGYDVLLPRVPCCGRSMISVGMLEQAIATADRAVAALAPFAADPSVRAILVVEPSCLSAIRDDWQELRCRSSPALRASIAERSMLVEEFIDRDWDRHPAPPRVRERQQGSSAPTGRVLLHAHCHQKALWGAESSARVLRRVAGDRCTVLPTGCCGMAGSFGYDRDKFDLSMRIANLTGVDQPGGGIMPHVRAMKPGDVLLATGTSCRHQVHDASRDAASRPAHEQAPVHAIHPVQWLDDMLF
jgi:FAD/FMN-containing dehydrogenase/Fe-S oxidoreductase